MDWANGLVVDGIWEALVLVVCFGKIECHTKHLIFYFLFIEIIGQWYLGGTGKVFIFFPSKKCIYLFFT